MLTIQLTRFDDLFSIPREPRTALGPGQHFDLQVPEGAKVLITDVYIENHDDGPSHLVILEQRSANSFEVRYQFRVPAGGVTNVHFTTGLRLGEEAPIAGVIRIRNSANSAGHILPRVNGTIVRELVGELGIVFLPDLV